MSSVFRRTQTPTVLQFLQHGHSLLFMLLLVLGSISCGGSEVSNPELSDRGVETIEVVAPQRLIVGEEYEIQIQAKDAAGAVVDVPPTDFTLDFATASGTLLLLRTETGFRIRVSSSADQVFKAKYKINPNITASLERRQFGVWTGTWTTTFKIGSEDWSTTLVLAQFGNDIVGTLDSQGGTSHFIDSVGATATDSGIRAKLLSQGIILTQGTRSSATSFDGAYTNVEAPRLAGALVLPSVALTPPNVIFTLVNR